MTAEGGAGRGRGVLGREEVGGLAGTHLDFTSGILFFVFFISQNTPRFRKSTDLKKKVSLFTLLKCH